MPTGLKSMGPSLIPFLLFFVRVPASQERRSLRGNRKSQEEIVKYTYFQRGWFTPSVAAEGWGGHTFLGRVDVSLATG